MRVFTVAHLLRFHELHIEGIRKVLAGAVFVDGADGRQIVLMNPALRTEDHDFYASAYSKLGVVHSPGIGVLRFPSGTRKIVEMFLKLVQTGQPQVPYEYSLELIAILEAGRIDGANEWQAFRRITVPIQHLTQAMEEVRTSQDFSKKVPRESDDERRRLEDGRVLTYRRISPWPITTAQATPAWTVH